MLNLITPSYDAIDDKTHPETSKELFVRTLQPADSSSDVNTLRTGSFKLFKRPFPGFLTILTL